MSPLLLYWPRITRDCCDTAGPTASGTGKLRFSFSPYTSRALLIFAPSSVFPLPILAFVPYCVFPHIWSLVGYSLHPDSRQATTPPPFFEFDLVTTLSLFLGRSHHGGDSWSKRSALFTNRI